MDTENYCQKHVPEIMDSEETVPLQRKLANQIINDATLLEDMEQRFSIISLISKVGKYNQPQMSHTNNKTETMKDDSTVHESGELVPLQRKLGNEVINDTTTSSIQLKKKEISWSQATYLEKVPLQDLTARSTSWMLERKTSVGPCYRKTMPYGEPSGITICLPKKSFKSLNEIVNPKKSGISITVSKRCFDNNKTRSPTDFELRNTNGRHNMPMKEKKVELKIEEDHYVNIFENIKGKIDNLYGKIKHAFHM